MNNQYEPKEKGVSQNTEYYYKLMGISEIKLHQQISGIFKARHKMIEIIFSSILEYGFDASQPLVIGRIKDLGEFLVDGHHRLAAAKKANIQELPVKIMEFLSLEDCQHYVIKRQVERRSLSSDEIVLAAMLLENKKTRDGLGRSGKLLADTLGVSESTINRAKTIAKDITEQELEELRVGIESINSLYEKRRNKTIENNDIELKEDKSAHAILDNKIIDKSIENDKISDSKTINIPEQQIKETKLPANNITNEKINKVEKSILKEQEPFSNTILIIINDIVEILHETKEINAIKIILSKYEKCIPPNVLFNLRKDYCQN